MFENWFKSKTAYVQVCKNQFKIYLSHNQKLFIVDAPFSHPRMLLGSSSIAKRCLCEQFEQQEIFTSIKNYRVIVHPQELIEGGLSEVEQQAFTTLFLNLGFRQVHVWQGYDLSENQIRTFDWKAAS